MGSKKHKKQKSENRERVAEYDYEDSGSAPPPEKPLKLVLNLKGGIGSSQESLVDDATSSPASEDRRHKHKKKKKKKSSDKDRERSRYVDSQESYKRRREEDDSGDDINETEMEEPQHQPMAVEIDHRANNENVPESQEHHQKHQQQDEEGLSPSRRLRERQVRDSDGYILRQMLNYLLKTLQNKDVNGFFAFPVTDSIAPGYSSLILHPMDFSTMAAKIEAGEYRNVMEFKKDFTLMCNNATTYNRPETIFYKEAKRLLQIGIRMLSKEKLLHLKKTHSYMASISLQELGFDESGAVIHIEPRVSLVHEEAKERLEESIKQEEESKKMDPATQEEREAADILIQAQEAAKEAKNKLVARKPKTDYGFLRMNENGTTSMTILNPWNDGVVSSKQRVISLGDYMGKLKNGTGSLFKHKEDKRNRVDTETYLCYGPFSSHAPSYDSSFATCTKEESDLLLSTYGGEIGVQYAKSVQKFVENAGSSAVEMVDKLLDTLTAGQHSEAITLQEQQKRREEEETQKALQDEMIAKAQQAADEAEAEAAKDQVQYSLNQTAALISELSHTQNERLGRDLPPHMGVVPPISNKEAHLADQVSNSLVNMARQVNPNDVISTGAVRGALGITTHPVNRGQEAMDVDDATRNDKKDKSQAGNTPYSSEDDSDDSSDSEAGGVSNTVGGVGIGVGSSGGGIIRSGCVSNNSNSNNNNNVGGVARSDSDDDDDDDDEEDSGSGSDDEDDDDDEDEVDGGVGGPESMEDDCSDLEASNSGF